MDRLHALVKKDDLPGFLALVGNKPVSVVTWDNSLIRAAAAKGAFKIAQWLLAQPEVDPNVLEMEPLRSAISGGHMDVVKLFLKCARVKLSSPPNARTTRDSVLDTAIGRGNVECVRLLLRDDRCDLTRVMPPYSHYVDFKTATKEEMREMVKYLHGHGVWTAESYEGDDELLPRRLGSFYMYFKPPKDMTFGRKDWKYFPRKRRRVYCEFLCCLRYLGYHRYMRDLHDTVMPYYFAKN